MIEVTCEICNKEIAMIPKGYTYRCGMCSMRASERVGMKNNKILEEATPAHIKAAIKKKKLTYGTLGFKLNESEGIIGQMARGERTPSSKVHDWVFNVLDKKDLKTLNKST